jgi:hypothetical protein
LSPSATVSFAETVKTARKAIEQIRKRKFRFTLGLKISIGAVYRIARKKARTKIVPNTGHPFRAAGIKHFLLKMPR